MPRLLLGLSPLINSSVVKTSWQYGNYGSCTTFTFGEVTTPPTARGEEVAPVNGLGVIGSVSL